MRGSSPIDPLISQAIQGVLAATVLQPDRWWYLSDLAKHLDRRPSSLQSPLAALVAAGVLSRRKDGNRVYFRANRACPFLAELRGLIAKTAGLVDVVREELGALRGRIDAAFVHGSVARSREHASSDVDLVVIGSVGLAELSPVLETIERRLGRPVNATSYSREDYCGRIAAGDHFASSLLADRDKLFVVGESDDLDRLVGRAPR